MDDSVGTVPAGPISPADGSRDDHKHLDRI